MENESILFSHPFSKAYWKTAAMEWKSLKKIVFASFIIALVIVFSFFSKTLHLELFERKIYFSFVPMSLLALLFGPTVAIAGGFIADIIGFMLLPNGVFFPGYTLSSILGALIYALFFYRSKITILRIFLAKFCVNIFVNAILGALWLKMMTPESTVYMVKLVSGLIKNIILLPFEVIILYLFFTAIIPIFKQFQLLSPKIPNQIRII
ncbi:MAG: folate family ECF transporter S component [Bacilli bacterium]|jgi:ECF transporter S component (folate family)|nr:folate family ECF transporter S component [Bacilli bacterium]MDY0064062.1 folate family ECF transporter S component [Bacilli bacterium]